MHSTNLQWNDFTSIQINNISFHEEVSNRLNCSIQIVRSQVTWLIRTKFYTNGSMIFDILLSIIRHRNSIALLGYFGPRSSGMNIICDKNFSYFGEEWSGSSGHFYADVGARWCVLVQP